MDLAHQAEVGELGAPLFAVTPHQEHIAGLHVTVHQAATVGVAQALGDAIEDAHDALGGDLMLAQHLAQGVALEVLHHEEAEALGGPAVVVDGDDVGVLQRPGQGGLAQEAGLEVDLVFFGQVGAQHLDRHGPPDGLLGGAVDPAATAASHELVDAVTIRDEQAFFEQGGHARSWGCAASAR